MSLPTVPVSRNYVPVIPKSSVEKPTTTTDRHVKASHGFLKKKVHSLILLRKYIPIRDPTAMERTGLP